MERSPVDSVGRFRRHLKVLQSTSPAASSLANASSVDATSVIGLSTTPSEMMPAVWANEARRLRGMRRRRQLAVVLLVTMGVTLALGLLPPLRPLLFLNVLIDAVFVGYLVLLARMRAIEAERQMVAHFARLRAEAEAQAQENAAEHKVVDNF